MTKPYDYVDVHLGEQILDECPRCRLPIYQSDPRRLLGTPPGSLLKLYHAGCAALADGEFWEKQITADAQRLRGLGYVVDLRLVRPVN